MTAFNIDIVSILIVAAKVVATFLVALGIMAFIRRTIPKVMKAKVKIPKVGKKHEQELAERSNTLSRVVVQVLSAAIWILAFVIILTQLGVDIAPLIAGIGVGALALGLAAQNILRDYMYGFLIIMEDWYRVGEVANIAGIGGLVVDINLRRTTLRDLDGTMHIIPNSKIELCSNLTREWARINLDIGVAYKENLDNVFRVINEVGKEMKNDPAWGKDLITTPEVTRVNKLGDNGIDIKILADTKPMRQWALTGELRKRLKDRFDEEGIEIPWPHTKLYFGNALKRDSDN
ncbi:mechanosensitive ion channel family protein [Chloroflexota bacterium]